MFSISTKNLLSQLVKYDFYDWEQNDEIEEYILKFGMPNNLLLNVNNFYDSWGFDAVQNEFANPSYTTEEWLELETVFFDWLGKAGDFLFPKGKVIATPNLERNWYLNGEQPPIWDNKNKWMKSDYDKYISLLHKSEVIEEGPSLREEYRAVMIEDFSEVRTLGKLSVKGVPLLFFLDEDKVITLSEYLSVIIYFRNPTLLEQNKNHLKRMLDIKILED
ncbi:hypothetical protein [Peribacillus muralis]|uniref:hypothetical protein n=1 Tax=Peribacillus muralis TaxID=264697 RepID=UPI000710F44C|nr:hypothetical protein [Peribacillus muralis]